MFAGMLIMIMAIVWVANEYDRRTSGRYEVARWMHGRRTFRKRK